MLLPWLAAAALVLIWQGFAARRGTAAPVEAKS
jgi:hypothetical protein